MPYTYTQTKNMHTRKNMHTAPQILENLGSCVHVFAWVCVYVKSQSDAANVQSVLVSSLSGHLFTIVLLK